MKNIKHNLTGIDILNQIAYLLLKDMAVRTTGGYMVLVYRI